MNKKFCKWKELFDRVLWVPLRNIKRQQNAQYNLGTLFDHEYFRNNPAREYLKAALWSEVHSDRATNSGNRTLFILDGLDELSQEMDPNNDMFRFLQDLLAQPIVIITSRPYVKLPDRLRPPDLELETIGFYPDQVNAYVEKPFTDTSTGETDFEKVDEVQSYLRDHQLIQGLVRIPIQLDAFCYTRGDKSISNRTVQTMTGLYETMECQLWRKDLPRLQRLRAEKEMNAGSRSKIEMKRLMKDEIYLLQTFAFTGLIQNITNFKPKHRERIYQHFKFSLKVSSFDDALANLSFLRTSDTSSKRPRSWTYHFIHQTYQEYFAAQYFVQQWRSRQPLDCLILSSGKYELIAAEAFLREEKYNAHFDILLRFVTGLLASGKCEEELARFFHTVEEEPRDLLGPVHQRLIMHCLNEVALPQDTPGFDRLRKGLEERLAQWMMFECGFTWRSRSASEIEFPKDCLDETLQQGPDLAKIVLVNSLDRRPLKIAILGALTDPHIRVPDRVLEAVTSHFEDEGEDVYVRQAAVKALRGQPDLSKEIVQAVVAQFKNQNAFVRRVAFEVLQRHSDLGTEIMQAAMVQLKNKTTEARFAAIKVLQNQLNLPAEGMQAIAALLEDQNSDIRQEAVEALQNQPALSQEILDESMNSLYPTWLERSFEEQISCYIVDESFYLNLPDFTKKVHLKGQQDRFRNKIQKVQKKLNVPLPSVAEM